MPTPTMGIDSAVQRLGRDGRKPADLGNRVALIVELLKNSILITTRHLTEHRQTEVLMNSTTEQVKHWPSPTKLIMFS